MCIYHQEFKFWNCLFRFQIVAARKILHSKMDFIQCGWLPLKVYEKVICYFYFTVHFNIHCSPCLLSGSFPSESCITLVIRCGNHGNQTQHKPPDPPPPSPHLAHHLFSEFTLCLVLKTATRFLPQTLPPSHSFIHCSPSHTLIHSHRHTQPPAEPLVFYRTH